jgi:hypothetical protein
VRVGLAVSRTPPGKEDSMRWGSRSNPGHGSNPPLYPGSFLLAFREALAGQNWQALRWLGHAVVCRTADGHEHTVGLDNLYRRARQAPREDWPALIADFLRTVGSVTLESGIPDDLNAAAGQLLPRIGRPFSQGELKVWSQPLGDTGLFVTLVVDYPDRMTYVSEDLVARSGQPGETWLGRALDNLQTRTPADWCHVLDEDTGVLVAVVGDAYDSSRVLLLDRLLPETAAAGCFVAPIGRDRTFLLPVSLESLECVHLLKVLADKDYHNIPYPITDQVLWAHGATWRRFPIELNGDEATATPPAELVELLNRLAGEDEGGAAAEETPE